MDALAFTAIGFFFFFFVVVVVLVKKALSFVYIE